MGMEWIGPVLAAALLTIGLILLVLSLGLFLYAAFRDIKAQIARDRAKAAQPSQGQAEAGQ